MDWIEYDEDELKNESKKDVMKSKEGIEINKRSECEEKTINKKQVNATSQVKKKEREKEAAAEIGATSHS